MSSKFPLFLTQHFTLEDFLHSSYATTHSLSNVFPKEYSCTYFNRAVSIALILEYVRQGISRDFFITSGFRTREVNRGVGGVKNSRHLYMCAVDVSVPDPEIGASMVQSLSAFHPRFIKYYPDKRYLHVDWPTSYLDGLTLSSLSSVCKINLPFLIDKNYGS